MKVLRARLARRMSEDGLIEAAPNVPIGKEYEVDIHRVFRRMPIRQVPSGKLHHKDMIMARDGVAGWRWIPLELIDIEIPQGLVPRDDLSTVG